jgi:hypothetical protein
MKPRTLCGNQPVAFVISSTDAPLARRNSAMTGDSAPVADTIEWQGERLSDCLSANLPRRTGP